MTCVTQSLVPQYGTDVPGAREKTGFTATDPWETGREYALRPGRGLPTLHTHPVRETVCVVEGTVGILTVCGGKADQDEYQRRKAHDCRICPPQRDEHWYHDRVFSDNPTIVCPFAPTVR